MRKGSSCPGALSIQVFFDRYFFRQINFFSGIRICNQAFQRQLLFEPDLVECIQLEILVFPYRLHQVLYVGPLPDGTHEWLLYEFNFFIQLFTFLQRISFVVDVPACIFRVYPWTPEWPSGGVGKINPQTKPLTFLQEM